MNNYLKLKIFIFCLIGFISSQTAFSYTFFVETSQFNDDVYVIENVVSDKENQSIDLNTGSGYLETWTLARMSARTKQLHNSLGNLFLYRLIFSSNQTPK